MIPFLITLLVSCLDILNNTTNRNPVYPPNANTYHQYVVASDGGPCSEIGADILQSGGSVVDSAIAALLCTGLYNTQSAGVGGGFFMTLYNRTGEEALFLNAREVAPLAANETMYIGADPTASYRGGPSIAVPTEVAGYWEAHQRYGKLPWSDLFQPSIALAENGWPLGPATARYVTKYGDKYVHNREYNLWPLFENEDGSLKQEGDLIRSPELAETYRRIAQGGIDEFYHGSLSEDILKDIQDANGIVTAEDFDAYRPQWKKPLEVSLDEFTVYTPGPPSGGPVLGLILNILDEYDFNSTSINDDEKVTTYHRIIEAFRFAFAKRSALGDDRSNAALTQLAANMTSEWMAADMRARINDLSTHEVEYYKPAFQINEDSGTAHLSIIGPNGDALSATSTVNTLWGSKVRGKRTGIIFNNEMADFSSPNEPNVFGLPPSPSNFIRPGHSPQSSMCPAIVVDSSGNVKIVAGASGGTRIISRTALTIINSLWFGMDIEQSVEMKQLHDQLVPDRTKIEEGFDQDVIAGLTSMGHNIVMNNRDFSAVQGIFVNDDGTIDAVSDTRKGGYPAGV